MESRQLKAALSAMPVKTNGTMRMEFRAPRDLAVSTCSLRRSTTSRKVSRRAEQSSDDVRGDYNEARLHSAISKQTAIFLFPIVVRHMTDRRLPGRSPQLARAFLTPSQHECDLAFRKFRCPHDSLDRPRFDTGKLEISNSYRSSSRRRPRLPQGASAVSIPLPSLRGRSRSQGPRSASRQVRL